MQQKEMLSRTAITLLFQDNGKQRESILLVVEHQQPSYLPIPSMIKLLL